MLITISGFKCFEELSLEVGRLTLFTGYNGAGKSSVIQTMLMLGQTLRSAPFGSVLDLDGPLANLGNAVDVSRFGGHGPISLRFSQGENSALWELTAERRARHLRVEKATFETRGVATAINQVAPPTSHPSSELCDRLRDLTFLGAARLFASTAWPSPPLTTPFGDVGRSGEFAPYWHFREADEVVAEERRHPDEERTTLRGQTDAYLSQLFPGAAASTDQLGETGLYRLNFSLGGSGWVRPGNTGFGLTYVFPLIVALLMAKEGQIVIVDSPEAHLHPRAQSELGKIVARFAAAGVQILVETHSDHFLNGVRIAVQNQTVSPDIVPIYFFGGASENGHGVSSLHIDSSGNIDRWPPGFFDQAEADLSKLLGLSA